MKYLFNKFIFGIISIIMSISILYTAFTYDMIKFEDNKIKMFRTENITCSGSNSKSDYCEVILFNGSFMKLKTGESILLNDYDKSIINLLNGWILILLFSGLIINHLLYNKNYNFKKDKNDLERKSN